MLTFPVRVDFFEKTRNLSMYAGLLYLYLVYLSAITGSPKTVISHREISQAINVNSALIGKVKKELVDAGLISVEKSGSITLPDTITLL